MVENPGSTIYEAIETSLNNGNLNNEKLLVLQKTTDPTSYIYIQTEVIRFTNDGSWISFNQITGEISGNMINEIIVGSKLKTDLFNGGSGDDILQGSEGNRMNLIS